MRGRSRLGVTLVELLVVIAIIGVLLGLLLPAVQRVRDAALKIGCANNLRQFGLALHGYHDATGSLPPGVTSDKPGEPYQRMSWLTRLLPHLEQEPLWQQTQQAYRGQPSPFVHPPHPGLDTVVRIFTCPSDAQSQGPRDTHSNRRVALTDYVGVLGTDLASKDGVLFVDSHVRLTDILDGTSATLMAGERPPSADAWYGWWYAGVGQAGTGAPDMLLGARELNLGGTYVWFCPPGPYHFRPGQAGEQCDVFHFWSLHFGGSHFLFADGAVRFLNYSADAVLPALATRAGSEAEMAPF
jgi:prepilin-type N-terminal cleavage/methylation domain-containing protein